MIWMKTGKKRREKARQPHFSVIDGVRGKQLLQRASKSSQTAMNTCVLPCMLFSSRTLWLELLLICGKSCQKLSITKIFMHVGLGLAFVLRFIFHTMCIIIV
jgi:hypothetical protein